MEMAYLDGLAPVDPDLATFANQGAEQDALAAYLAHFYAETPFGRPETPPLEDRRIQDLSTPGIQDSVFSMR